MLDTVTRISLTRLLYLAEYVLAEPAIMPDPPPDLQREIEEAAKRTREFLADNRPQAGPFFVLASREPK